MVAGWELPLEETLKSAVPKNARSAGFRPLPKVPEGLVLDENGNPPISLVLFYQYVEPAWTPKEHRSALGYITRLGKELGITGRGRCATEGLNCTLSGPAEALRKFCQGLRDWKSLFDETDFKFTDGLPWEKRFRSLTIQKKEELVAYGLPVSKAPSLKKNGTQHLEAIEYHKKIAEPNTVIVDIRNRYETEIGRFQPPPDGAQFIDPKVRNSHEFPKWLNLPETKQMLAGKQVMMYCTGGIRCERFSALLNQMKRDDPEFKTEGEYMVRGGIERYIRTFPEGGYWKGRNFLFDRRMEQVPEAKDEAELEKEVESKCCVCKRPWGIYRGGFKCHVKECMVPIIVCPNCVDADKESMQCPLCEEGFSLRGYKPPELQEAESQAQKRKVDAQMQVDALTSRRAAKRAKHADKPVSRRLFVGSLPFVIDADTIRSALGGGVELIHWIHDPRTLLFYGSSFVQMESEDEAKRAVELAAEGSGIKLGKRRLRVNFAPPHDGEVWPPENHKHFERPPVPPNPGCVRKTGSTE
eukprot:TRINITY_DN50495_c0_g1_i1.p1 TRINITY_DN50495_c0_g1~~TRINITY_DN50495_c0_g1_i1.p1  ORF type:complete len:526 (+),score=87.35 TRINITY_DN50495_c0_g1_i1:61-1638(+)